jgi:hypothetical protein
MRFEALVLVLGAALAGCGGSDVVGDAAADGGPGACAARLDGVEPYLSYAFDGEAVAVGSLATATGSTALGDDVSYEAGRCGAAVRFAGRPTSELHLAGSSAAFQVARWTLALWVLEDTWRDPGCVVGKGCAVFPTLLSTRGEYLAAGSGAHGFETYHGAYGTDFTTCFGECNPPRGGCGSFPFELGAWHHVALVHAGKDRSPHGGADLVFFVDGNEAGVGANADGVPLGADRDLRIGRDGTFLIDDLAIYGEALSGEAICVGLVGGSWDGARCAAR